MADRYALGIDVGTGSTKAGLVGLDGVLLAVARQAHPPNEAQPGWSEADPWQWWDAVGRAVREVLANSGASPSQVSAISLSGQMHGVVICGSAQRSGTSPEAPMPRRPADAPVPLRSAVLWSDRRSQPDLERIADALGPADRQNLANPIVTGMAGPTLAALRRLEPELMAEVRLVLQPKDWIRACLVGQAATEPSDASGTLLWDLRADGWSEPALAACGVDPSWLPPVVPSGEIVGELTSSAAAWLGLPAGTPVAAGGADTAMALVGSGVALEQCQLTTGSGGQLVQLIDQPLVSPTGHTHLYRAVSAPWEPPRWYAMAAIQNAGLAIDWALRTLGLTPGTEAAAVAVAEAVDTTPVGSEGLTFLPYLTGERTPHLDANLSGAWVGLRPGQQRALLLRSVFEGVTFALTDGLRALRAAGHTIESAALAGGGSLAPWWRQMLADGLNLPLMPKEVGDASVLGAGLTAWRALGQRVEAPPAGSAPGDAAPEAEGRPITPNPQAAAAMSEAHQRFRDALPVARPGKARTRPEQSRSESGLQ